MITELEMPPVTDPSKTVEMRDNIENKEETNDVFQVVMAVVSIALIFGVWSVVGSIHI